MEELKDIESTNVKKYLDFYHKSEYYSKKHSEIIDIIGVIFSILFFYEFMWYIDSNVIGTEVNSFSRWIFCVLIIGFFIALLLLMIFYCLQIYYNKKASRIHLLEDEKSHVRQIIRITEMKLRMNKKR